MATIQVIEPLAVENVDCIRDWLARLDQAIECAILQQTGLTPENQQKMRVAYLLSNIGQSGFRVLRAYCTPGQPSERTYDELVKLITDNLAPAPSNLSEGYAFSNLKQEAGETLSMYMARLMDKANNCDFGTFYDRMVKDRFIYGLKNEKIRQALLGKSDLDTAAKALKEAITKENALAANQNMSSSVNHVKNFNFKQKSHFNKNNPQKRNNAQPSTSHQKGELKCSKCTLRGHLAKDCAVKCRYCKKIGHLKANCGKRNNAYQCEDDEQGEPPSSDVLYSGEDREEDLCLYFVGIHSSTTSLASVQGSRDSQEGSHLKIPSHSHDESAVFDSHDESGVADSRMESAVSDSHDESAATESHYVSAVSTVFNSPVERTGQGLVPNFHNESSYNLPNHVNNNIPLNSVLTIQKSELSNQNLEKSSLGSKPIVKLIFNGQAVNFELDTGAAITCISKLNFDRLKLVGCRLVDCSKALCVANGQIVNVKSKAMVSVRYKGVSFGELGIFVVESSFPTLLGREWIRVLFGSDWLSRLVNNVSLPDVNECRQAFIEEIKQSPIFLPEEGDVRGFEAKLNLK